MATSLSRHAPSCICRCLQVSLRPNACTYHQLLSKSRVTAGRSYCFYSEANHGHIPRRTLCTTPLTASGTKLKFNCNCKYHVVEGTRFHRLSGGVRFTSTSTSELNDAQKRQEEAEKRKLQKAKKEARRQLAVERQKKNQEKKQTRSDAVYSIPTKSGDKKDTTCPLPDAYSPEYVEAAWYDWWETSGFFTPNCIGQEKKGETKKFVLCLPPPNVTGTLHLGHALGNSIQDSLARWHRMRGDQVLWLPGTDHAGIATQVVVEKKLWRDQYKTRHQLGRDGFIDEVWKWKKEKGSEICKQMRRLGSSLDWSREYFTLDPNLSYAVNEAFIRLHEEGLIYRKKRLVNWSCTLKSAISDIEVDNVAIEKKTYVSVPGYEKRVPFGEMLSFAYPVEGSDEEVIISTTRLETMLGDSAVAVHPEDSRYTHLHGKTLIHPITGASIPVICDEFVDREFGTGAVKITPGHDYNDYDIGNVHKLPLINILDDSGRMVNVPEQFLGKPRFTVRNDVQKILKDLHLFRGAVDHEMVLPTCSRSGDIIEPLLKDQWYVDCTEMAQSALKAVESGDLELIPARYNEVWNHWLENIRDWCISRQLWWGHRIPVYKVTGKGGKTLLPPGEEWISAHTEAEACQKAVNKTGVSADELSISQDEDVLDTWFSSSLIPFSSLGWPNKNPSLDDYYPSQLLETASDILFFWVARMVMMGQKLTGELPFKQVLLHSILRDSHGRKMSKSLGNIVDPMDVMHGITLEQLQDKLASYNLTDAELKKAREGQHKDYPLGIAQCGADALHFTLCSYNFKNQFVNVTVGHVEAHRRFCNKIWQAFRFSSQYWPQDYQPTDIQLSEYASATDRWILSELSEMVAACQDGFTTYNLHVSTSAIYNFFWLKFCDIYLEYSKSILTGSDPERVSMVTNIMHHCLSTSLRALAPFMPFLCEELFQRLPGVDLNKTPSVMVSSYPSPENYPWKDDDITNCMSQIQSVINQILSLRKDFAIGKSKQEVTIVIPSEERKNQVESFRETILALSRSSTLDVTTSEPDPDGCVRIELDDGCILLFKLKGLIDTDAELEKLEKRYRKLEIERERIQARLAKSDLNEYTAEFEKDKLTKALTEINRLNKAIQALRTMG